MDHAQYIQNEKSVVKHIPGLLYDITKNGMAYGLRYCRSYAHKRNKPYLSLRMRYLKYKETWKCKAALSKKQNVDKKA